MHFKTGYYWSAGPGGGINQDAITLQHVACKNNEVLLAAVCDGIGSHKGSEDAAGYVAKSLTDWLYNEGKYLIRDGEKPPLILLSLQRCIHNISQYLTDLKESSGITIGTTCSALLLSKEDYYLIHIGDSRIYRVSSNNFLKKLIYKKDYIMEVLTHDHKDKNGRLLKAIGISINDKASFDMGKIKRQTAFLICSDGLYQRNDANILNLLGGCIKKDRDNLDRRLEMLSKEAVKNGNKDNISGILIKVC